MVVAAKAQLGVADLHERERLDLVRSIRNQDTSGQACHGDNHGRAFQERSSQAAIRVHIRPIPSLWHPSIVMPNSLRSGNEKPGAAGVFDSVFGGRDLYGLPDAAGTDGIVYSDRKAEPPPGRVLSGDFDG